MPSIIDYPVPDRPLVDGDPAVGWVDGKTVRIPVAFLTAYMANALAPYWAAAIARTLPIGAVRKEALFSALEAAGHLGDLLSNNLPPVVNADGSINEAGWRLHYAQTVLPSDPAAIYIQGLYYSTDAAGFNALFEAAGA
jgi:hypothetical protein